VLVAEGFVEALHIDGEFGNAGHFAGAFAG
jgi:hypothetical protein